MSKKSISKIIDTYSSLKKNTNTNQIKKEENQNNNINENNNVDENNITFMEELPYIEAKESFHKSMMQNQFLHHLRNKNIYIAIQTITNETYIGTLISFDEYTIHVYVEDKKFNSAMLFFKSGLAYIRVLTEAAYQYYINKMNNENKQNTNYNNSNNNNAKIKTTNKIFIPAKTKIKNDNNFKSSSNSINDMTKTLSSKFNVTTQNKSKRKDF